MVINSINIVPGWGDQKTEVILKVVSTAEPEAVKIQINEGPVYIFSSEKLLKAVQNAMNV